jgi:hypothetical protein
MWGIIKVRVYNEKPADILQVKRQVYMELNGFSSYKNSTAICGFVDVQCALNMVDNSLNNFCTNSFSIPVLGSF